MNRPWMPFYVADYLADTGHLSTTQHGAYVLLILHYWRTGGLPDDDAQLARITKLPRKAWVEMIKADVQALFHDGWRHKRIDKELAKQDVIATKRSMAGQKGGQVTAMSRVIAKAVSLSNRVRKQANADQMPGKRVAVTLTKNIPLTESERETSAASVESQQAATDKKKIEASPELTTVVQNWGGAKVA